MMRLSVESGVLRDLPHKDRLLKIKEAGFDAVDFSFFKLDGENAELLGENYAECAGELREYMNSIGIVCTQAHAPFDMKADDPISEDCEKYVKLVRSIEAAGILGAPYIVVHSIKTEPEIFHEYNRAFYLSLLPYAERAGVKIAVENLFGPIAADGKRQGYLADPEEHMSFVRSLGSPYFNICLDIGHSAVTGRAPEDVIRAMDPELFELMHAHDNDGISDLHGFPYAGTFNWTAICAALAEIGYHGNFSLELIGQFNSLPTDMHVAALAYAERLGRKLVDMCKIGG